MNQVKPVRYYIRSDAVNVHNADEVVPYLLERKWRKEGAGARNHLLVSLPPSGSELSWEKANFFDVAWDDIDDGSFGYRIARLRCEGKLRDRKIFALIELDMDMARKTFVTLSPVRFGINGKPVLPYKGVDLAIFLRVVRALTLYPEKIIDVDGLVKEVKPLLLDMGHHIDFWDITASYWFGETDKLGITQEAESNQHTIVMLPQEVDQIFGLSLFGS